MHGESRIQQSLLISRIPYWICADTLDKTIPGARALISRHDTEDRQVPALLVPTERVYTFTTEQPKSETHQKLVFLKDASEYETYHNPDTYSNGNY